MSGTKIEGATALVTGSNRGIGRAVTIALLERGASKAAVHSLTQASRALLAGQGTQSYGVYPGPVDTDMAKELEMEKATPQGVADAILDGIEAGHEEIYTDPFARQFAEQFQTSPKTSERQIAAMVTGEVASKA